MAEQKKKTSTRRIALGAAAVLLILAIFIGTTFAQLDAGTDDGSIFYKARLVEEYDDDTAQKWISPEREITKRISVQNPGKDGDETDGRTYGHVFARIQLKEFMELYAEDDAVYSENRYMLDKSGMFLAFDTKADAQAYCMNNSLGAHTIDSLQPFGQSQPKWYIQTKENDPNGVYGNFLILYYESAQAKNLIQINPPVRADMDAQRAQEADDCLWQDEPFASAHNHTAACDYTIHRWHQGLYKWEVNGPDQPSFMDHVYWTYGQDVVLLSQWDGKPCDKWIVDDSAQNTQGWVYWGNFIAPGQQTGDFITGLRQAEVNPGSFYYAVHTDMETVSYSELNRWSEAADPDSSGNDKIVAALRQTYPVRITARFSSITPGASALLTAEADAAFGVDTAIDWSIQSPVTDSAIDPASGLLTVGADETAGYIAVRAASKYYPGAYDEWIFMVTPAA